eukprot:m51a1_g7860 hypothetical protein (399) ;mRNA; r:255805-257190
MAGHADHARTPRVRGLQLPLNALQVLSFVFFGLHVGGSHVLRAAALPVWPAAACAFAVLGAVDAVMVAAWAWVSWVDPADRTATEEGGEGSEGLFCTICRATVAPRSKHCRVCNKCVSDFDHHCIWVNSCVGGRNYRAFFVLVSATLLGLVLDLALCVFYIAWFAWQPHTLTRRLDEVYGMSRGLHLALDIVYVVLDVPLAALVGQLFFFHVMLWRRKLSTYDYILIQRGRREKGEVTGVCSSQRQRWRDRNSVHPKAGQAAPAAPPLCTVAARDSGGSGQGEGAKAAAAGLLAGTACAQGAAHTPGNSRRASDASSCALAAEANTASEVSSAREGNTEGEQGQGEQGQQGRAVLEPGPASAQQAAPLDTPLALPQPEAQLLPARAGARTLPPLKRTG